MTGSGVSPSPPKPVEEMTPAEYGEWLASQAPPLPDEAIDEAARIYAAWLVQQRREAS